MPGRGISGARGARRVFGGQRLGEFWPGFGNTAGAGCYVRVKKWCFLDIYIEVIGIVKAKFLYVNSI